MNGDTICLEVLSLDGNSETSGMGNNNRDILLTYVPVTNLDRVIDPHRTAGTARNNKVGFVRRPAMSNDVIADDTEACLLEPCFLSSSNRDAETTELLRICNLMFKRA